MSHFVGFDDVLVLNADGHILGSAVQGSIEAQRATLEMVGLVRHSLPDGGSLVCVPPGATEPARRFARAFVHEVRSPLNALAINLDLALTYAKRAFEKKENGPKLEIALERAGRQVSRVDELLRMFLSLWASHSAVEDCNLVEFAQAAFMLGTHVANRREGELEINAEGEAKIRASGRALADALFCLLDESMPKGAHVVISIRDEPTVTLTVDVTRVPAPSWMVSTRAFSALGAEVTREAQRFIVAFAAAEDGG